jgi:hypothetical protein
MTIDQFVTANPNHRVAKRVMKIMEKPARSMATWSRDGAYIGRVMRELANGSLK